MKTLIKYFFFFIFFSIQHSFSQNFEGKMVYQSIILTDNVPLENSVDTLNEEFTLKNNLFKHTLHYSKVNINKIMGGEIIYYDKDKYLINHYRHSIDYVERDFSNENSADGKWKKTKETRKILGYNCTLYKYSIKNNLGDFKADYWITDEIKIKKNYSYFFDDKGVALEFSYTSNSTNITKGNAILIKETHIDDNEFALPKDYIMKNFDPQKASTIFFKRLENLKE